MGSIHISKSTFLLCFLCLSLSLSLSRTATPYLWVLRANVRAVNGPSLTSHPRLQSVSANGATQAIEVEERWGVVVMMVVGGRG